MASLEEVVGQALVEKLLEETPIFNVDPVTQQPVIIAKVPSVVRAIAQQFVQAKSEEIFKRIWDHIDIDVLSTLIAQQVVVELLKPDQRSTWGGNTIPNARRKAILERVDIWLVNELGQRAASKLEVELKEKSNAPVSDS